MHQYQCMTDHSNGYRPEEINQYEANALQMKNHKEQKANYEAVADD